MARVKAAEQDSPAQLAVGRALTKIEGVPVGEIRDKKSWLAIVGKLQAPDRPLSLTFEAPAVSPEEPVQPVQRARAELDALAASAKAAAEQAEAEAAAAESAPAPARGRQTVNRAGVRFGPRSRSPSPELTCSQCCARGTELMASRIWAGAPFWSAEAKTLGRSAAASSRGGGGARARARARPACPQSPRHGTAAPAATAFAAGPGTAADATSSRRRGGVGACAAATGRVGAGGGAASTQ